jgi:hypothetical protein
MQVGPARPSETQVGGAQLRQLAAGPQPRQRQRRASPAGHHHPQARRQILQQERNRLVCRPGVNQVVIIEDQQHLIRARIGGQLVDQGRHQPLKRTGGRRAHPPGQSGPGPVQRGHHVTPEPGRVAVAAIQAQPRHRPPATTGPVGQQRRFAGSRRGAHQHPAPSQALAQRLHQARARHKSRLRPGNMQLGRQQDILPGPGNPRRGRPRRVSHR